MLVPLALLLTLRVDLASESTVLQDVVDLSSTNEFSNPVFFAERFDSERAEKLADRGLCSITHRGLSRSADKLKVVEIYLNRCSAGSVHEPDRG